MSKLILTATLTFSVVFSTFFASAMDGHREDSPGMRGWAAADATFARFRARLAANMAGSPRFPQRPPIAQIAQNIGNITQPRIMEVSAAGAIRAATAIVAEAANLQKALDTLMKMMAGPSSYERDQKIKTLFPMAGLSSYSGPTAGWPVLFSEIDCTPLKTMGVGLYGRLNRGGPAKQSLHSADSTRAAGLEAQARAVEALARVTQERYSAAARAAESGSSPGIIPIPQINLTNN